MKVVLAGSVVVAVALASTQAIADDWTSLVCSVASAPRLGPFWLKKFRFKVDRTTKAVDGPYGGPGHATVENGEWRWGGVWDPHGDKFHAVLDVTTLRLEVSDTDDLVDTDTTYQCQKDAPQL